MALLLSTDGSTEPAAGCMTVSFFVGSGRLRCGCRHRRFVGSAPNWTSSARSSAAPSALELDPNHARAVMGLALWHLQLAKRGFGWLYGASLGEVVPLFEWAVTLAPQNVEIRKNYGFVLMQLGRREAARAQLEPARALPVQSVPDRLHHDRAAELLRELPTRK